MGRATTALRPGPPTARASPFISDRGGSRDVKDRSAVYVVPASGGIPHSWSDGLTSADAVVWSTDGLSLAVIGSEDEELAFPLLFLLTQDGSPRRLTDDSIKMSSLRDGHRAVTYAGRPHSLRRRGEGRGAPLRARRSGRSSANDRRRRSQDRGRGLRRPGHRGGRRG